jgi:adenylate kinase
VTLRIVLLGAPGSGKGTQGRRLADRHGVPLVATGEILREAVRRGTPLGRQVQERMDQGSLVSDETMIGLVGERLGEADAAGGFVLDGFPRTLPQAEALDRMLAGMGLPPIAAVYLRVPAEVVVQRLARRLECPACRRTYNPAGVPPRREGVCDTDGTVLVARKDDDAGSVRRRLEVYLAETAALLGRYRDAGRLVEVDADREPDGVFAALTAALDGATAGRTGA